MALMWFDVALVLFILFQVALGIRQGFLLSLASFLTFLLSLALALFGGPWLAARLAPFVPWPAPILALALALGLVLIAIPLLTRTVAWAYAQLPSSPRIRRLDRAFGVASGALRGLTLSAILVGGYAALALPDLPRSTLSGELYQRVKTPVSMLAAHAQREFPALLVTPAGWEVLVEPVQARESIAPDQLATEMLGMVNQERRERGLAELRWDGDLAAMALAHSKDMLARNYFAHEDPEGQTATQRAAKAGITYSILGENLAFAKTLPQAHRGLMNSPGHRENILRPEFRRLGIGIVRLPPGSRYLPKQATPRGTNVSTGGYLLITQNFAR